MLDKIRIPYTEDQVNAFIDSCLYGGGYGMVCGSFEYVKECLRERGITEEFTVELDDANCEFIITIK